MKTNNKDWADQVIDTVLKPAVGYIRVSSETQLDGNGLEVQEATVRKYAERNGYHITHVYREEGVSGTLGLEDKNARIAWIKMMNHLETNTDVQTIIIPKLDRLARDLLIQEAFIKDIEAKNLKLISVQEPDLDSNDPSRKLFRQIMGAINEFDKTMIVSRLKAGRIQNAERGDHAIGRIPMGYKSEVVNGKKMLVHNDEETEVVRLIFELKDQRGMSFQKIADYLNANNYRPKANGKMFYNSTIQRIYNNLKYKGTVTLNDKGEQIVNVTNESLRMI